MTKDEIISMANEAHGPITGKWWDMDIAALERFAALVAAVEREACAKVCEAIYNDPKENNGYDAYYTRPYLECAEAIRARGNA